MLFYCKGNSYRLTEMVDRRREKGNLFKGLSCFRDDLYLMGKTPSVDLDILRICIEGLLQE